MAPPTPPTVPVVRGTTAVCSLSVVLALLFLAGRLISNTFVFAHLSRDDYASIAGTFLFVAYAGVCIGIDYFAHRTSALAGADITDPTYLKLIYNAELLYALTSVVAKLSILLLYLRIFSPSTGLRRAIYAAATAAATLSFTSVTVFSIYCAPRSDDSLSTAADLVAICAGASPYGVAQQAADASLNLFILLLPVSHVMALNLSLRRRLGVVFILMHGIFALLAAVVAMYFRAGLLRADAGAVLWWRTAAFECCAIELGMTLVSGSLHACWGFLRHLRTRRVTKSVVSRSSSSWMPEGGGSRAPQQRPGSRVFEPMMMQEAVTQESALSRVSFRLSVVEETVINEETKVWVEIAAAERGVQKQNERH